MEITNITKGEVITKSEKKEYSSGKFLQTFRLRTDEAYPTMLEFTMYDKGIADLSEKIEVGSVLIVKFNVKGRDYNDRLYFTLQPWSVEVLEGQETKEETTHDDSGLVEEDNPF
jgi:hypothetical protein